MAGLTIWAGWWLAAAHAAEPATPATVESLTEIAADEPLAKSFSLELAALYLDRAALDWQKTHACIACHMMLPYMMARPALNSVRPQPPEVRQFFEEIAAGKREAMPAYECKDIDGAVAIGVASALALNDRSSTGKLHPLTRQALDRMWTVQRSDGAWQWPFRDTPPLKVDEHYGAALAAIAVGMAPGDYAGTPAAQAGLARIRQFLLNSKTVSLHQRAMMLWASAHVEGLLSGDAQAEILGTLLAAQRPDGGWSMASLVDNTSDPSVAQERVASMKAEKGYGTEFLAYVGPDRGYKSSLATDGYATGFAVFVARQAGVPAADRRLERGVAWLRTHQRASGRWFTPSQAWHTQHLISNAGTAYAVLALDACGEVPRPDRAIVGGNH
ncbi:MAG: squalene--hopene cyclase [Planctomycetia bacterium]|nr:squalene--hopene cyclase [Planctomycetia bacterium]